MNLDENVSDDIRWERAEKELIRSYFDNKKSGFFVEIGANEPLSENSQSWHLESQIGWKGILVEPNPRLAEKARISRPGSLIFESACVSPANEGVINLYIPLVNDDEVTGHAAIRKNIDDFSYQNHKVVNVKARTLNSILEEAAVGTIDILTIDVEGAELEVLRGLDIEKYKPGLILLEDKHVYLDKHRYLKKHDYQLVKRTTLNCWYVPKGAKVPYQSLSEKIRLWKRMYLSIWLKKIKHAMRSKSIEPFSKF